MPEHHEFCKRIPRRVALVCDPCFQRNVSALRALGDRGLAEFLAEIADAHGIEADIRRRLEDYGRASPELLADLGADRFPVRLWRAAS